MSYSQDIVKSGWAKTISGEYRTIRSKFGWMDGWLSREKGDFEASKFVQGCKEPEIVGHDLSHPEGPRYKKHVE